MPGNFNEATRVQMPALVHLTRLGYTFVGKIKEDQKGSFFDGDTNILIPIFKEQFEKLNPEYKDHFEQVFKEIKQELDNDDIGRSFYKRLTAVSPIKLIDFENPDNNVFSCTAEFTCKRDEDEFRPDITLFINGLPLCFIEVKKPNNPGGMIAEARRMNEVRFTNKKFRRFINITQLMIFSNNMEYDTLGGIVPVSGAFYCTGAKKKTSFNCFREENRTNLPVAPYNQNYPYKQIDPEVERKILSDFNNQVLHTAPEYQTNLGINTPTNRIITSMCSKERILYLIKYGIAYVKDEREVDGRMESIDEKHIMRYQQLFASLAIREKIDNGVTSGVVWHTQGSGKTALSYYLNYVLTDYFAKKNKVAKFYFIVDRLDLLEQASQELSARGLAVKTANTREELMSQFRNNQSLEGDTGSHEVVVVNIHRFAEDHTKIDIPSYATNLQRVFIIDEAHRGYKPEGSFLLNLFNADTNSIKIALTGTPLLKEEKESWRIFGTYYHTYYYDKSIEDGYTLKVMREPIETSYKEKLSQIYEKLETLVQKKDVKRTDIIEHDVYVKELLRYIIDDLKKFRILQGDNTLGGMIICETSEQARKLYAYFDDIQNELNANSSSQSNFKAGLILYDSDDKEVRKQIVKDFKKNMTIDILIVFNMLLTGFDAPRLKRLYFGRKLKDHNLLQAITRVNRPYKDNRYGFVIDFADIKENFEQTNEAYIRELNRFNDPNSETDEVIDTFGQVLENKDKIIEEVKEARQTLFELTLDNAEVFSQEVTAIDDKEKLLQIKKALTNLRDAFNLAKTFGDNDLKDKLQRFEIGKLPSLISEVQRCIDRINQRDAIKGSDSTKQIINEAMQDIEFRFTAQAEEELKIVGGDGSELKQKWSQSIREFSSNIDQEDPEYITLREAFMQRCKEHGFVIENTDQYKEFVDYLDDVLVKLKDMKRKNDALLRKYNDDKKFVRAHKRIREENNKRKSEGKKPVVSDFEIEITDALNEIKDRIDKKVYDRNDILKKDVYFEKTVMSLVSEGLDDLNIENSRDDRLFIQSCITNQYLNQYRDTYSI